MIDANEQIDNSNSGVAKLTNTCNLVDIIGQKHPQANNTASYARGTKRIDFILISQTLAQSVINCGMLAFYDGIHSDHR